MIPKIIHYCWLSGDPIPESLQRCMDTWKKMLPDYEWMLWNFDRFPKSQSKWVSDAFDAGKYAFAADYIRLYAVYHHGGFYLDMDVEVLKSFDPLLSLPYVLGWQHGKDMGLEVAAFGAEPKTSWVKDCLDFYDQRTFIKEDGKYNLAVMPNMVEAILRHGKYELCTVENEEDAHQLTQPQQKRLAVFTPDFLSPKSYQDGIIYSTVNTYCIHNFAGSWLKNIIVVKKEPLSIRLKCAVYNLLKKVGLNKVVWQCLHPDTPQEFPYDKPKEAIEYAEMLEHLYQSNLNKNKQ